ncbi:MAG: coagulation factor 5/8 type domain-containing protein, partial [Stackebrandtia sp.]
PYDPPNQQAWMNGDTEGYAAYKVDAAVTAHEAWGLGSYCFFNVDPAVAAARAFEVPESPEIRFHNLTAVSLGGTGTIRNIINTTGGPADSATNVATVTEYP